MEQNFYFERLLELKNNFSVKVIVGVRGSGKSTLLKTFAEKLRAEGVAAEEIIFIDCEENHRLKNFEQLYELIAERTAELEKFFLLIDELDRVAECEKTINALFVSAPAEIYVTGSSEVLAEKIAALLPQNCDVLKMYPLSFAEYAEKFPSDDDALRRYLNFGGFQVTLDADEKILPKLLRGVAYELLYDVAEKNSLSDLGYLRSLAKFVAHNVGKPFTVKSIAENNPLKVRNFLSTLMESGLFKKIPRYDIKAGEFIRGGDKFYCADNGIITALAEPDDTILMENAVCNELWRRGFAVSSGKFGAMNISFMATRGDEKIFIQVLPTSGDVSVRKCTRPLRALPDNAEKLLITIKPTKTFGGVKVITLRDFLLNL